MVRTGLFFVKQMTTPPPVSASPPACPRRFSPLSPFFPIIYSPGLFSLSQGMPCCARTELQSQIGLRFYRICCRSPSHVSSHFLLIGPVFHFDELLPELQLEVFSSASLSTQACLALTAKRFWAHPARPRISQDTLLTRIILDSGSPSLLRYALEELAIPILPTHVAQLASSRRTLLCDTLLSLPLALLFRGRRPYDQEWNEVLIAAGKHLNTPLIEWLQNLFVSIHPALDFIFVVRRPPPPPHHHVSQVAVSAKITRGSRESD